MSNYSIVRSGNEYVVRANAENILRVASRRRAAKLIVVASQLLDLQMAMDGQPGQPERSIARDASKVP